MAKRSPPRIGQRPSIGRRRVTIRRPKLRLRRKFALNSKDIVIIVVGPCISDRAANRVARIEAGCGADRGKYACRIVNVAVHEEGTARLTTDVPFGLGVCRAGHKAEDEGRKARDAREARYHISPLLRVVTRIKRQIISLFSYRIKQFVNLHETAHNLL